MAEQYRLRSSSSSWSSSVICWPCCKAPGEPKALIAHAQGCASADYGKIQFKWIRGARPSPKHTHTHRYTRTPTLPIRRRRGMRANTDDVIRRQRLGYAVVTFVCHGRTVAVSAKKMLLTSQAAWPSLTSRCLGLPVSSLRHHPAEPEPGPQSKPPLAVAALKR